MRIFCGCSLSDELITELTFSQAMLAVDSIAGVQAKSVRAANLHLTLKFLGRCSEDVAEACAATLQNIATGTPSFELVFDTLGCFPARGPVRIIWAGCSSPAKEFQAFVSAIDLSLEHLAVQHESREPHPHVTLFRVKEDRSNGRLRQRVKDQHFPRVVEQVDSVALFESITAPDGVVYRLIQDFPMRE